MRMTVLFFLFLAALLEVGGDAIIGTGVRSPSRPWLVVGGALLLAAYGYLVNQAPRFDPSLDLGKLLGTYVAVFALIATCWRFREIAHLPPLRWIGLGLVMAGGIVIQYAGPATTGSP